LNDRGALPAEECIAIALSLTRALAHLHKHGLVHRDVKPSNVIFVGGAAKLADIGLVTSVDATRSFVGTEGYLPPGRRRHTASRSLQPGESPLRNEHRLRPEGVPEIAMLSKVPFPLLR
jgi:serine/threonine protein kinase